MPEPKTISPVQFYKNDPYSAAAGKEPTDWRPKSPEATDAPVTPDEDDETPTVTTVDAPVLNDDTAKGDPSSDPDGPESDDGDDDDGDAIEL